MTEPTGPPAAESAGSSGGVGLESVPDPTGTDRRPDGGFDDTGLDPTVDGVVGGDVGAEGEDADDLLLDEPDDWAWVEEWREGDEPVPWGPGLGVAGFTLILVASAVFVLSSGLSDKPVVAIAVNLLVAAGLGPALWLSRGLPGVRWLVA